MPRRVVIRADGAARGNPGPSSAGAVVIDADGDPAAARRPDARPLATVSDYLGRGTNNVAEYTAVVRALEVAARLGAREVELILDSNLVVEQLAGRWRVKDAKLAPLHARATALLRGFDTWSARQEPRARNHAADALANEAIDRALAGGSASVVRMPGEAGEGSPAEEPRSRAAAPELEPGFDPGDAGPDPGELTVTILGSGTSGGVPRIACGCPTCTSADPRDSRSRASALLAFGPHRVLIDAGPDLRAQALREGLDRLDAVLLTHEHADAVGGLDDLRRFNELRGGYLDVRTVPESLAIVVDRFRYAFDPGQSRFAGLPMLRPVEVAGPFLVGGRRFVPVPVIHGERVIAGYRTGGFAYCSDVQRIDPDGRVLLRGLDTLVVSALRDIPHPTHQTVEEALALIADLRPRRAVLTHLDHDLTHAGLERRLPPGVEVAWDGLRLAVPR
ncbi:MAG: MBL fold metallo-hydrolase [Chloroflexi bacterium]|nr:MBL fold metallo-hydrolase [Chloroflexota bacterium]